MTTAIALFGTRISPRFDCAQDFMLITSSESTVTDLRTETIRERLPIRKVKRLADLKVDVLICGGVDESSREHLRAYGIKVLANMKGNVDDAVSHCLPTLTPTPLFKKKHPSPCTDNRESSPPGRGSATCLRGGQSHLLPLAPPSLQVTPLPIAHQPIPMGIVPPPV